MSDLLPSLIIAASDLKVVSLLRDAINAGLPKTGPLGTIPPGANPHTPRPRIKFGREPGDRFDPQPAVQPSPRFEPRPVIHPEPRVEISPPVVREGGVVEEPRHSSNPIEPPWKTLPPVEPEVTIVRPKVIRPMVDLIHKGTLLDLFV